MDEGPTDIINTVVPIPFYTAKTKEAGDGEKREFRCGKHWYSINNL